MSFSHLTLGASRGRFLKGFPTKFSSHSSCPHLGHMFSTYGIILYFTILTILDDLYKPEYMICRTLSTLKTETARCSEMSSPNIYQTTRCHILEHSTFTDSAFWTSNFMWYMVSSLSMFRLVWFRAVTELWHKAHTSCSIHDNTSTVHVKHKIPQPGVFSPYFELWYRLYQVVRTWGRQQVLPGWVVGRPAGYAIIIQESQWTLECRSKKPSERKASKESNQLRTHNTAVLVRTLLLSNQVN
jgi:hypothetical protein